MITAASLKTQTVKDLSQMARQMGVSGWSSMRKDQLVQALVKAAKSKARKRAATSRSASTGSKKSTSPSRRAATTRKGSKTASAQQARRATSQSSNAKSSSRANGRVSGRSSQAGQRNARVVTRIRQTQAERERSKDLSTASTPGPKAKGKGRQPTRDRIVLLVRDSYWMQACWDVTRQAVERARAAMAEHWHTAVPTLRLLKVDAGTTTSTAEQVVRDITIHGGVKNWYIDIQQPLSYCVCLGYLGSDGKFFTIARSNIVSPPTPGSSDAIDENWTDIAEDYERIYALSGGYSDEHANGVLQELFEERLRRPMGSPVVTRFGEGADKLINRRRDFAFQVDAEMIIYGSTKPDAHVSLANEPIKLRPDGTFTVRLSMPDKRQVLPVVASSADGVEQRTIVLAVERNTKVMEPMIREGNE